MNALNWVLTGVNALGAVSGWLFMIIYTKRSRWWGTEHRAHLGWTTLSLTMIMSLYVFRAFMDPATFAYVRAPLYLAVVMCMVWRLMLLLRSKQPDQVRTDVEDAADGVQYGALASTEVQPMATGLGVDVHPYYQRGARFDGVEYAWVKMADGARPYSAGGWTADAHAAALLARGIPFGGYVYAQPGDGAAEAHVLWSECIRLGGTGVAPACDIEDNARIHIWGTQEAIDHGRAFCAALRATGVRPAIYMNDSMAGRTNPASWPENPVLWIARYGARPQHTRYDVHQFSDQGSLPGSAGAVDWNRAYTTAHLLGVLASGEDDELNDNEKLMLRRIYGQLTGTEDVTKGFPGFPSREYPAVSATPVDFIRAMDQNILHLTKQLADVSARLAKLEGGTKV